VCTCANSIALFFEWFFYNHFHVFFFSTEGTVYPSCPGNTYACSVIKIQKWIQKHEPSFYISLISFPLYEVLFSLSVERILSGNSVNRFFMNQEIPGTLWNLKVVTMFIRAQPLFLSRATLIQLTPCHLLSCRCILISFSNRCLHLRSGLLLCVSLRKSCVCLSSTCVLHVPPISFCLI